jgi:hypothetical protein
MIIPYPTVRNILVQRYLGDKTDNWATTWKEYDLDIRPAKIVKGKRLYKLAVVSVEDKEDENDLYQDQILLENEVFYILVKNDQWYYEIKYYLTHGSSPRYMEPKKKRALKLKSTQYHFTQGILFKNNYDGVFLRYLEKEDVEKFLSKLHY